MTPDDQHSDGEPHPPDVQLARIQAVQEGRRRSLWTLLWRARRGEVTGDDAGEAAVFGLVVVMMAAATWCTRRLATRDRTSTAAT